MRLLLLDCALFYSALNLYSNPLDAQTSSYHTELSNEGPGLPRVVLANDSDKAIEAFHLTHRCEYAGGATHQDILDHPGNSPNEIHKVNGRIFTGILVEPEDRLEVGRLTTTKSRSGMEECDAQIDAVIFADGSYEGKEVVAQGLQARRDGISASVNYWAEKFDRENPDGSGLAMLLAEAKRRVAEEKAKTNKYPFIPMEDEAPPLLGQY